MSVSQKEILDELLGLDPSHWLEVRDFILFLKQRAREESVQPHARPLTGQDLCDLASLGLWADRDDIGDSPSYARELRWRSGHRLRNQDAAG